MRLERKRRAALLLCSVALLALTGSAFARPHHKPAYGQVTAQAAAQPQTGGADRDDRYTAVAAQPLADLAFAAQPVAGEATQSRRRVAQSHANSALGGFTTNSLVSEARKYIGTNPTGRGSLWCGAFMDLVLKRTGHAGGGNLALGYTHYGTRVAGPQVGAIAVMGRRGGGHVGVVTGIDPNGNPIIVSGNTWNRSTGGRHTVAESVYPRERISAYVMPGG
jgi:uncharacterized protein (TIGR02594 family)